MMESIVMPFELAGNPVTGKEWLVTSARLSGIPVDVSKQRLCRSRPLTSDVVPVRGRFSIHCHNSGNMAAGSIESHEALSAEKNKFLPRKQDQTMVIERRWEDFFKDPSQWWDHRLEKGNPKYPDFRHKKTGRALWLNGKLNPSWVAAKFSETELPTLQEATFVWNKRLEMHVKAGENKKALELFFEIQRDGIFPDKYTFVTIIRACSRLRALRKGQYVHKQILDNGFGSDDHVTSSLVDMYAKCGSLDEARRLFDNLSERNIIAWNAMLLGYAKSGQGEKALELWSEMLREEVEPDSVTFVGIINACASLKGLEEGKKIHEQTKMRGWDTGTFIGTSLIAMYAACCSIENARQVFDNISLRDVACWNAMIDGYVECKQGQAAVDLARGMEDEGVEPDAATFMGLFYACASLGAIEDGRRLHQRVIDRTLELHVLVGRGLIHMYCRCGHIKEAWRIFNIMPIRDVKTWNAMIDGCLSCNRPYNVLEIYPAMGKEGVEPDVDTFAGVIRACGSLGALQEGIFVHEQISQKGFESAPSIRMSLIVMYTRCRRMDDACKVFDQLPDRQLSCWNAMIYGFVRCGQGRKALDLYSRMRVENLQPNLDTCLGALDACASVGALEEGRLLHTQICELGYESNVAMREKLEKMYAACKSFKHSRFRHAHAPISLLVR